MVELILLCAGIGIGWTLAGWITRAEIEQRERIWRTRLRAAYPATRPLTLTFTDDGPAGRHVEAAEVSVN